MSWLFWPIELNLVGLATARFLDAEALVTVTRRRRLSNGRRRVSFRQDRAADFTRGDGPYAVLAIGLASGLPRLARSGPSRGFPCQIRRGPGTSGGSGPKVLLLFAPAARRWRRRSGSASGSGGVRAVSAARAARRGRLEEPYRNFSHRLGPTRADSMETVRWSQSPGQVSQPDPDPARPLLGRARQARASCRLASRLGLQGGPQCSDRGMRDRAVT
jgi:hypothetical protein